MAMDIDMNYLNIFLPVEAEREWTAKGDID
jgi:hypothetical protein